MRAVQMLGAGFSWGAVPPLDPDAETWGTNNVMWARYAGTVPQWDRWFDLHPSAHIQQRRPLAYDWYTRQDGTRPIYQWEVNPEIPGSVVYPKDRVLGYFSVGGHQERDFWGSISWMLALAIVEGFTKIELFWFALMNDQYTKQVPSTRYWIGQARGRGVRVTIHGDSMLKPQQGLYGCEALSPPVEITTA